MYHNGEHHKWDIIVYLIVNVCAVRHARRRGGVGRRASKVLNAPGENGI